MSHSDFSHKSKLIQTNSIPHDKYDISIELVMQNACKHGFSLNDLQLKSFIDILYSTETQEKPRSNFVIVVELVLNNAQWEVSERREKKKELWYDNSPDENRPFENGFKDCAKVHTWCVKY